LALGCSFTYGAANPAEDTFPFLVAQGLGGTELNAGACSYGLAQMQILAERLIPKYRPDYVIVQSSAWLWERSVAMFLPTYFSVMPSPYFYDEGADIPKIHPPVFESAIPDMPMDKYRETSSSLADRMHFIFEIGIPLVFHDDFHMAIFHLKRHFIPQPASFSRAKFIGIYRYIDRLVRQAGGQTVILVLGGSNRKQVDMLTAVNHAIVVDGERKLLESLKDKTADAYSRTYCHWRNDRLVDSHPNARAHRLFTQAILDGIAAAMDAAAVGSLDRTFTGPADSKHPKDDL
jgi:hypothetical protein